MYKNYLINGKEVSLYINDIANTASWWHPKKKLYVDYKINKDKDGREFVIMKSSVIYLDENITLTLEECKELAGRHELRQHEFVNAVLKIGVDKLRLIVPCRKFEGYFAGFLKKYSDERYPVECYIDESNPMRQMKDNYKVIIQSVDAQYDCKEDWYLSDLVSCINQGYIKIA